MAISPVYTTYDCYMGDVSAYYPLPPQPQLKPKWTKQLDKSYMGSQPTGQEKGKIGLIFTLELKTFLPLRILWSFKPLSQHSVRHTEQKLHFCLPNISWQYPALKWRTRQLMIYCDQHIGEHAIWCYTVTNTQSYLWRNNVTGNALFAETPKGMAAGALLLGSCDDLAQQGHQFICFCSWQIAARWQTNTVRTVIHL